MGDLIARHRRAPRATLAQRPEPYFMARVLELPARHRVQRPPRSSLWPYTLQSDP